MNRAQILSSQYPERIYLVVPLVQEAARRATVAVMDQIELGAYCPVRDLVGHEARTPIYDQLYDHVGSRA